MDFIFLKTFISFKDFKVPWGPCPTLFSNIIVQHVHVLPLSIDGFALKPHNSFISETDFTAGIDRYDHSAYSAYHTVSNLILTKASDVCYKYSLSTSNTLK